MFTIPTTKVSFPSTSKESSCKYSWMKMLVENTWDTLSHGLPGRLMD